MKVLETERLILRWLSTRDAEFVLRLLNEPSWLKFIGDKGVKNIDDARRYILTVPLELCRRLGFGHYLVELKTGNIPIGLCGLRKRESLAYVDLGFALLPEYWGRGYAYEAAAATLEHGRAAFGLTRIVGITSPDNEASAALLKKLGMRFDRVITFPNETRETMLFVPD